MATGSVKYFSGDIELTRIDGLPNAEFHARFPNVKGRPFSSFERLVGSPIDETPVWNGTKWNRTILPVERVINYSSQPSLHKCDARCMFARGRIMNCECSCGGKNHGKGSLSCF